MGSGSVGSGSVSVVVTLRSLVSFVLLLVTAGFGSAVAVASAGVALAGAAVVGVLLTSSETVRTWVGCWLPLVRARAVTPPIVPAAMSAVIPTARVLVLVTQSSLTLQRQICVASTTETNEETMRIPGVPFIQGRNSYGDGDGRKYGIAIHNTSNDASARGEASYATRRTDGVSAHFYADATEVIQSLDTSARAGHAGSRTGNENSIAVEITGSNGWTRQQWLDRVAWDKLAAALAVVCRHYGIEPRRASVAEMKANPQVRAFYGHDDMRRAWGGTTHTDPGPNFPWDHLLEQVKRAISGEQEDDVKPSDQLTIAAWGKTTWPDDKGLADGKISAETAWGGAYLHARLAQERTARLEAMVQALTKLVGGDDADRVITEIRAQHEQTRALIGGIVPQVLAALPAGDGPVSREDLEAALRAVLGSVDGATPQG